MGEVSVFHRANRADGFYTHVLLYVDVNTDVCYVSALVSATVGAVAWTLQRFFAGRAFFPQAVRSGQAAERSRTTRASSVDRWTAWDGGDSCMAAVLRVIAKRMPGKDICIAEGPPARAASATRIIAMLEE